MPARIDKLYSAKNVFVAFLQYNVSLLLNPQYLIEKRVSHRIILSVYNPQPLAKRKQFSVL